MRVTTAFLADAAAYVEGKLYVHGGGWDVIWAESAPVIHASMALVLQVSVDFEEITRPLPLRIGLLSEDSMDPLLSVEGELRAGLGALAKKGDPVMVTQVLPFHGTQFPKLGGYFFHVSTGETELARVRFQVCPRP